MSYSHYTDYYNNSMVKQKIDGIISTISDIRDDIKTLTNHLIGVSADDFYNIRVDLIAIKNLLAQIEKLTYSANDHFINQAEKFDSVLSYYKNFENEVVKKEFFKNCLPLLTDTNPLAAVEDLEGYKLVREDGMWESYLIESVFVDKNNNITISYTPRLTCTYQNEDGDSYPYTYTFETKKTQVIL